MIRRQVADEFYLITQNDHAVLSGEFARHLSDDCVARPEPYDAVMAAISMHDAGWPMHDETPTLNDEGLPRDVFESNAEIALPVWQASADQAQQAGGAYAGLLASLHVLALSRFATSATPMKHEKFDTSQMKVKFEVNKFQHHEIERQEKLRKELGMRTDIPLEYGLARPGVDGQEDQLRFNFRLLQAMDQLSLAACCTEPPSNSTTEVFKGPGGKPLKLKLKRIDGVDVAVDPWPFNVPQIPGTIPFRRVRACPFANEADFHAAYRAVATEHLNFTVRGG